MILDERLEFMDAGNINTGAAGTYLLGDVVDSEHIRSLGDGEEIYLVITVDTSLLSATGGIQFKLVSDAQAAIATDNTATEHVVSPVFTQALATAGNTLFVAALPAEGRVYERYLGILQVTSTAAFTAGKINAFLTLNAGKWRAYPDAVN